MQTNGMTLRWPRIAGSALQWSPYVNCSRIPRSEVTSLPLGSRIEFHGLSLLRSHRPPLLLRMAPGADPRTHQARHRLGTRSEFEDDRLSGYLRPFPTHLLLYFPSVLRTRSLRVCPVRTHDQRILRWPMLDSGASPFTNAKSAKGRRAGIVATRHRTAVAHGSEFESEGNRAG